MFVCKKMESADFESESDHSVSIYNVIIVGDWEWAS